MAVNLMPHQIEAVKNGRNGCIFNGGVGTGKSITSLGYFYVHEGGDIQCLTPEKEFIPLSFCRDLYIITTPKKRDSREWDMEIGRFLWSQDIEKNVSKNHVVIDSWNNIGKYTSVKDAFFIFDEHRAIGKGAWSKSFIKISKANEWVLLTATAGDCWSDYVPVFIANGFYKNRTEFEREHVVWNRFTKYPSIDKYINTGRLLRYREALLVDMEYQKTAISHHIDIIVGHDSDKCKRIFKDRWNEEKQQPIETASELCYELRKVINKHESRAEEVLKLAVDKGRIIVFYNFDYELEILKNISYPKDYVVAEWNGHKHQEIPDSEHWVYCVQYTAGAEGWNCIKTDTVVFYSQSYSYKATVQACGRIDRLNTPYSDLYYFHLRSKAGLDLAITKALREKKQFNERSFVAK